MITDLCLAILVVLAAAAVGNIAANIHIKKKGGK
jgi:hypothetical protein